MNVEILARVQFAMTIMFHYIYPPLSIGLGLIMVIMEGLYLKTGNILYHQMARFWTRIFALTFAIGVATGIVMEFEFGTNWSTYSRYVGDVFGSALAAEGVFAFFLESGFLAILLFGWNRVSAKVHFFSTVMVTLGAHFSAIWIIVANSWMQTPAGYHIVGEGLFARAEITDFWQMVFNPSSVDRLIHSIFGAWLAGAFLVISVSSYYLLKKRHLEFAKKSLLIALTLAQITLILQLVSGHSSAKVVAENQPMKLAAMEGIFTTEKEAPLTIFGFPNVLEKRVDYQIAIPGLLSTLLSGSEIKGLQEIPSRDWPNVPVVFASYHLMLFCWGAMVIVVALAFFQRGWKKELTPWTLKILIASVFLPQLANQAGWVAAETGRYPWIVQGLLRISEGLSTSVTREHVLGSLILFTFVYFILFLLFLFLLNDKIKTGPKEEDLTSPYHNLEVTLEKNNGI